MPKVAGTYRAIVRIKKEVGKTKAESKQDAIRIMLLGLAHAEDQTDFTQWVEGGMEIELTAK